MELVIKQEDLRAQLSRTKVNFKKSPKDRLTLQHLDTRIKLVEQKWEQFNKTHDQILDKIEQLRDTNYFTEGVYEETEEFYIEFISELKGIYEKLLKASNTSEKLEKQQNLTTSASIKLPKISIPAFSGLYTEWMSFRDMFMSLIHTNRNLDDVQKMHYLKSHLSGEAELLLRHIPVTKDNYEQSWNLLVKRYNNKQYLANCILKRFFGLRNVNNESSAALKELLDVTTDTLNALKNLNIDVKSWDVIVIYIVSLKLDQESRKLWEAEVSKSVTNTENLPTLDQFFEFLQNRYHSLEFMDTKLSGNKYYNNNYSSKTHAVQTLHVSHEVSCAFCKGSHRISSCKEFINKECDTKRNFVQENGLCFNCLAGNHSAKQCRSLTSCFICRKRHHTLLHMKNVTAMNTVESTEADAEQEVLTGTQSPTALTVSLQNNEQNIASLTSTASVQTVLLATALVKASSVYGNYQLLRSLVDQGSQASFITEAAAQLLGLKRTATSTAVAGLGGDKSIVSKSMVTVSIQSLHDPSYIIQVRAFILDKLTAHLPSITLEVASWPELEQIKLADPNYNTPNKIDILLGAEVYGQIIKEGLIKYPSGSPIAQNTSLGWILSGQTRQTSGGTIVSMHVQVDELLKLFWETEKEPLTNKKIMTEEENKCEEMFKATTRRDEEGRYIVRLPFRNDNPACLKGHSRSIAMKMFFNRERKLQNNPTLKEEYIKTFNEYTELNHMEAVPEDESYSEKENCFYIPYHEVIREDRTTTKVRVVFHASMKGTNGVSLNDDLMVGPSLQSELRHLIMRWRVYPIVFTADVVKMYRQIKVDEKDADFQRIIWRDDPQKKLEEHRMLRLTFGTASAPYLAVRCLMQVAIDEAKDFPIAAEIVQRDFYMDDLMSGCFTENESIVLYEQISEMLRRGGFILQKWITNSEKLIQRIQDTKEDAVKKFEIKLEEKNKILGLIWNRKNDEFEYAVQLMQVSSPVTKRKVIADIARLYDPIGWIAPTVIKAKILIQKIWLSGITWDQELPPDLLHEWLNYRNDITNLTKIRIPRWLNRQLDDSLIELHGFCDASNEAYAAVVYTLLKEVFMLH